MSRQTLENLIVRLIACLVAFMALTPVAHAKTIDFNDYIDAKSMAKLVAKVQQASASGDRNITIKLGSDGGELIQALNTSEILKRYNVNTLVTDSCSSSCTVLFAAGRLRSASSSATFLFHALGVAKKHQKLFGSGFKSDERNDIAHRYAALWTGAIRAASPSLAAQLEKEQTFLRNTRVSQDSGTPGWTLTGSQLRRYGYVND